MTSASFGILSSVLGLSGSAFMYLFVPILTKHFKDSTLLITGLSALVASSLIKAVATNAYHLYTMVIFTGLCSFSLTTTRSILSKIVGPLDVGKVLAVLGALQSLIPFMSSPFFAYIYRSTLATTPNAFIFTEMGLYSLTVIMGIMIKFLLK